MISVNRGNTRYFVVAVLTIAGIFIALFYKNNYFLTVLCQVLCYFIAAAGLNFVTGLTGQANLGMAGIFSIGAYTSALCTLRLDMSPWLCFLPVLFMGWLVGKLLGYPSLRVEGVYLSLTTIVFSEIVRITLTNLTDFSGGAAGLKYIPTYRFFGADLGIPKNMLLLLIVISLIVTYISDRVIRSRWGRAFVSIRDNIEAVGSCGINVSAMKITAYTLSTLFGALSGALYAHFNTYLNPMVYNSQLSTSFVVMLIIGGIGTVSGCLIGSIVVRLLPEMLRFMGNYYQFVYSIICLLCIVFLPGGLVSYIFNHRGTNGKIILETFIGKVKKQ